jgi:hypothetical protein
VASGITSKIIVTIEGKGRIMIDDDIVENLPEKRSKNRRVDLVLNLKPLPKIELPDFTRAFKASTSLATTFILKTSCLSAAAANLPFRPRRNSTPFRGI